jgi:hypothetical protein
LRGTGDTEDGSKDRVRHTLRVTGDIHTHAHHTHSYTHSCSSYLYMLLVLSYRGTHIVIVMIGGH